MCRSCRLFDGWQFRHERRVPVTTETALVNAHHDHEDGSRLRLLARRREYVLCDWFARLNGYAPGRLVLIIEHRPTLAMCNAGPVAGINAGCHPHNQSPLNSPSERRPAVSLCPARPRPLRTGVERQLQRRHMIGGAISTVRTVIVGLETATTAMETMGAGTAMAETATNRQSGRSQIEKQRSRPSLPRAAYNLLTSGAVSSNCDVGQSLTS